MATCVFLSIQALEYHQLSVVTQETVAQKYLAGAVERPA